ncbi:MAG: helix-turn-helix transcriptional regulator [Clostridia bacterium]|nr:helix-turn-helix transcriptional regulator [Clostridia bacterium]
MNIFFGSCSDAINHANETKMYGVYYTEDRTSNTNIHVHECCEVFFCVSGGKNFLINDRVYDVSPGDMFVINQFEPHKISFSTDEMFGRFILQVHPAFLYGNSTEHTDLSRCFYLRTPEVSNKLKISDKDFTYFQESFMELRKSFDYGDDIIKNSIVLQMLVKINSEFAKGYKYIPNMSGHSVISKSVEFINNNLSEQLSLELIAKNSFVSVNQLCRLFKNHLGTTVTKYIISRRITEAKKLLRKGTSVSETALSCGFFDYANFIRTFKNTVGVSPGKYIQINPPE